MRDRGPNDMSSPRDAEGATGNAPSPWAPEGCRRRSGAPAEWWRRGMCVASVAAASCAATHAQQVLVPAANITDRTPSVDVASSNWVGSANAPLLLRPSGPETYPLEVGPIRLHPHLGYQLLYGDGILRGPGEPAKTALHTLLPGLYLELGPHWDLDASAGINRYSNAGFHDNTSYHLGLRGLVPLEDWSWAFGYQGSL